MPIMADFNHHTQPEVAVNTSSMENAPNVAEPTAVISPKPVPVSLSSQKLEKAVVAIKATPQKCGKEDQQQAVVRPSPTKTPADAMGLNLGQPQPGDGCH